MKRILRTTIIAVIGIWAWLGSMPSATAGALTVTYTDNRYDVNRDHTHSDAHVVVTQGASSTSLLYLWNGTVEEYIDLEVLPEGEDPPGIHSDAFNSQYLTGTTDNTTGTQWYKVHFNPGAGAPNESIITDSSHLILACQYYAEEN